MVECEGRRQGEAGAGLGLGEHDKPGGGELVLQAGEPGQGDAESVALHRDLHLAENSSPSMKSIIVSLLFSHKQLSSPWLRWLDTQDTD